MDRGPLRASCWWIRTRAEQKEWSNRRTGLQVRRPAAPGAGIHSPRGCFAAKAELVLWLSLSYTERISACANRIASKFYFAVLRSSVKSALGCATPFMALVAGNDQASQRSLVGARPLRLLRPAAICVERFGGNESVTEDRPPIRNFDTL